MYNTTDTQEAPCDDAHDKKLDGADFKFTEAKSDKGLERAVSYPAKANKNSSSVVHCSQTLVLLRENNVKCKRQLHG